MLHSEIQVPFELVTNLVKQITNLETTDSEKPALIIQLRAMWLLERVARNSKLFKEERQEKLMQIFVPLCDLVVYGK